MLSNFIPGLTNLNSALTSEPTRTVLIGSSVIFCVDPLWITDIKVTHFLQGNESYLPVAWLCLFSHYRLSKPLYPAFLVILLVTGNIAGGGWKWQGKYAKLKLQKTASFIELKPLNLRLLMSYIYIYGALSKARNANVVYIWTYVWQRWNSLFLFAVQCFSTESMQRGFLCHICV